MPRRAGATASSHAPTSATPVSTHGPQAGAFGQIPTWPRNAVPSTPAAEAVVTAWNVYVPSSPIPETTPARGPSVRPTKAYTDPACS